jgi:DNA-binding beta-propeller fold protein YncE
MTKRPMTKRLVPGLAAGWSLLLPLVFLPVFAGVAGAATGDTVADRVLGQRRFSTSTPYFVDGRVFAATDLAVDRSATPNRIWLADAELNRVLGWADIARFRAGADAGRVLGQPSLFVGANVYTQKTCPVPPSATSFCRPTRVAVDPRGNVYVADMFNFRVLEFDNPFAGDRTADRVFGQPDFTSRAAAVDPSRSAIDYFEALGVDRAGNVWMVDPAGSRRVLEFDDPITHDTRADRAIEPGTRDECFTGNAPRNRLCQPADIEVAPQGDLYVQDFRTGGIGAGKLFIYRRPLAADLTPGVVLTGAFGHGGAVFDPAGNLYATGGFYISRLSAPVGPGSAWETIAGPFLQEAFTARPDRDSAGNLYAAGTPWPEGGNDLVDVFDAPFQRDDHFAVGRARRSDRGLAFPTVVAVDRSSAPNHLYALDTTNRVLGWRDAAGFASGAPADLVLDGNDPAHPLYSCDTPDVVVSARRFCVSNGAILGGMAVDSRGGLWLSDVANNRVLEFDRPFDTDGVADRVLGQDGSFTTRLCRRTARGLCNPGALAFDRDDNLYVADLFNHRVLLFRAPLQGDDAAGKVFGQPDFQHGGCSRPSARTLCFGFTDGTLNDHFFAASGLAVDARGNLYVSDAYDNRVLIFLDAATSDTVADAVLGQDGKFTTALQGTGPRRFGGFQGGLAIGPGGELYVADTANDRLLVFDEPLRRDTADRVFGHPDFDAGGAPPPLYDYTPPATAASLLRPRTLAFDASGNLYVADTEYNRVLRFDRP